MENLNSGWQELTTQSRPRCPKLFYNFTASDSGYELYLTDLIALWKASATQEEINDYAKITRASIDPSDKVQLQVLFKKLAQSLTQGSTTLQQAEENGLEAVLLTTSIKLPRPLQPLKWEFYLETQAAAEMAEMILRPCLHEASEARRKIDSLIEHLSSKDRIISKLIAKIEASSVDLSLIFPGITGVRARKGHVTLREAQQHVPGLSEFQKDGWQQSFNSSSSYTGFEAAGLYKLVAGNENCPKHTSQQHQRWFHKLPKSSATISQLAKAEALRSSSPIRNDSTTEDEFETHKKRSKSPKSATREHSGSPSDHDQRRGKLGRYGSHAAEKDNSLLPTYKGRTSGIDSDATESSSDSDLGSRPKAKGRLGRLRHGSRSPENSINSRPAKVHDRHVQSSSPVAPITSSPPPAHIPNRSRSGSNLLSRQNSSSRSDVSTTYPAAKIAPATRMKRDQPRKSATPEVVVQQGSTADGAAAASTQTTPSRHRLGRLGRSNTASQPVSPSKGRPQPDEAQDEAEDEVAQNSDASTASADSPLMQKTDSGSIQLHPNGPKQKALNLSKSGSETPDSEMTEADTSRAPEVELTKEEKQMQRREELKRKNLTGSNNGTGTNPVNNGGLRKKRKF